MCIRRSRRSIFYLGMGQENVLPVFLPIRTPKKWLDVPPAIISTSPSVPLSVRERSYQTNREFQFNLFLK